MDHSPLHPDTPPAAQPELELTTELTAEPTAELTAEETARFEAWLDRALGPQPDAGVTQRALAASAEGFVHRDAAFARLLDLALQGSIGVPDSSPQSATHPTDDPERLVDSILQATADHFHWPDHASADHASDDASVNASLDASLEALVSVALAPQALPPGVSQRVIQSVQLALAQARQRPRLTRDGVPKPTPVLIEEPSVIARLGYRWPWVRAAAAAVVLLAWLGVWVTAGDILKQGREAARFERLHRTLERTVTASVTALAQSDAPLAPAGAEDLDQQVGELAQSIEQLALDDSLHNPLHPLAGISGWGDIE